MYCILVLECLRKLNVKPQKRSRTSWDDRPSRVSRFLTKSNICWMEVVLLICLLRSVAPALRGCCTMRPLLSRLHTSRARRAIPTPIWRMLAWSETTLSTFWIFKICARSWALLHNRLASVLRVFRYGNLLFANISNFGFFALPCCPRGTQTLTKNVLLAFSDDFVLYITRIWRSWRTHSLLLLRVHKTLCPAAPHSLSTIHTPVKVQRLVFCHFLLPTPSWTRIWEREELNTPRALDWDPTLGTANVSVTLPPVILSTTSNKRLSRVLPLRTPFLSPTFQPKNLY